MSIVHMNGKLASTVRGNS